MSAIKRFVQVLIRRPTSTSTDDLLTATDETGSVVLLRADNGGTLTTAANGMYFTNVGGQVELRVISGDGGTQFRFYNAGGGGFHFTSFPTYFEVPALRVKEGSNQHMGTAVLVAGTVTVSNTAVTANSRILLTAQNTGGTAGELSISARTAGTSFTITSASGSDTRTIAWLILEPTATI
jgi:hypothetical protein